MDPRSPGMANRRHNIGSTISICLERNYNVMITVSVTNLPQLKSITSTLLKLKSGSKEPLTKKLFGRKNHRIQLGYQPRKQYDFDSKDI